MDRFTEDVYQNIHDYLDNFDLNACSDEEKLEIAQSPWGLGSNIESAFFRDIGDPDDYEEARSLRYNMKDFNDPAKTEEYLRENLYDILDFTSTHMEPPNIYRALTNPQRYLYEVFDYARQQILHDVVHSDFSHLFRESRKDPVTAADINAVKKHFASILEEVMEYRPTPESIKISVTDDLSKSCKDFISAAERLGCKKKKIEKGFAEALKDRSASL